MTQRAVSVSKNICSFLWDQKLFEELLVLGELGFWGGFSLPFFHVLRKEKHSWRFAAAWSPPSTKAQPPS